MGHWLVGVLKLQCWTMQTQALEVDPAGFTECALLIAQVKLRSRMGRTAILGMAGLPLASPLLEMPKAEFWSSRQQ